MYGYKKLYIDGTLQDASGGQTHDVFCPANDDKIGEIAWASREDTLRALTAAQTALPAWRDASVATRVKYMLRLRDLVVKNETLIRTAEMDEHGKTYDQTGEGFEGVVNSLEFYAQEIKRMHGHMLVDTVGNFEHQVIYRAAGVVGAFVAWNFPLLNLAFKLGPAMATGCPIIIRPSEETPITAYIIGELCAKAELPPGVVNIIAGSISNTAEVITKSAIPAMLTLIGSTETGRKVMEAGSTSIKKYSMELGGNAPVLVFHDADIDLAASIVALLKFSNSGQICVTPERVFVHESVHKEFVAKILEHAKAVKVGHGKDSSATMGPLINRQARDRVDSWVKDAEKQGATIVYGGEIPSSLGEKGSYYMPTVIDNVNDSMRISCDEIFGPVVPITSFTDYDEVIARANATEVGLASYVFSRDITTIQKATRDLDFGEVQVNGVKYNMDLPHIGIKQSGIGLDGSHFALDEYLVKKRITTARL